MKDNIAETGVLAHHGHDFCPYAAVAKFPYKYISRNLMQPVSDNFFANGLFRERGWTLYYLHTYGASTKPLLLVPALEVEALLHDINSELGTFLNFPRPSHEPGFHLHFDEPGCPRPRYLGRVDADVTVDKMEAKIPGPDFRAQGEVEEPDDRSFEAFKAKMKAATQAAKNRTKSQKDNKKKQRILQKQSWCEQLKRAQCYLGVRPRRGALAQTESIDASQASWDDYMRAKTASDLARCINLPELDVTKPVPYSFSQSVVFICVDIEAWEKDHNAITEIGISTLDTNDLLSLAPGKDGEAWMTAIRPRHFRIKEFQHLSNSDFVEGCADKFEKDFGTSEFISIKEAPLVIASCFKPPFSAAFQMKSHTGHATQVSANQEHDRSIKRKIALVGHDTKSDINFMRNLGYDVSNLSNVLEALDTADMWKALKHEGQSSSLGRVLLDLEMVGWNLHNAGNDAAYTLQAMIGIVLAALHDKSARTAAIATTHAQKMEDAAHDAQDRIKEEGQEWELADHDEGDGGAAHAISRPEAPMPVYHGSYKAAGMGRGAGQQQGQKMNAAARRAMQEREAKKAHFQAEVSAAANGGAKKGQEWENRTGVGQQGRNASDGPSKRGNAKSAARDGGVKIREKGPVQEKKVLSVDDLAPKFKNRLAMLDTTGEEAQGGVKL